MASKKKTPAKPQPTPGTWHVIKNDTTGEVSIADSESFDYAQKCEPKAHQWKIDSTHKSEEEATNAL